MDLIERVELVRRQTRTRQAELARVCGITQGHMSKVLSGRVRMTADLRDTLTDWLARNADVPDGVESTVRTLVQRLGDTTSMRRENIMHILRCLTKVA